MKSSLHHVYIQAPPPQVRAAWRRFHRDGRRPSEGAGVHFIPAEGGCVVVAEETRNGGLPLLNLVSPDAGRHCEVSGRDLERFRESFEKREQ